MMRIARCTTLFVVSAALALAASPRFSSVEPGAAKPGDEVVTNGENLGSDSITRLFLTAGGVDIAIDMAEQTAESIHFVVPTDIELGSYRLMVQTAGPTPALLEQPWLLEVVTAEELAERAKSLAEPVAAAEEPAQPAAASAVQ